MKRPTEIRQQFIDFFLERGHTQVPSVPVVPAGDPTLLFINAGMNQFKDVFLGQGTRSYSRAVNSQKCIRVSGKHNDLDFVGPSPSHHTFFEMLGNWSFGDYYKREAVHWAWELVTGVWKVDKSRLYATVYEGGDDVPRDDEARQAWLEETDITPERVSFHGRKDNFWEMGEVGPCGPCSELHYDLGPEFCRRRGEPGHECGVNTDCGRIVELWNLVFIQYRRDEAGRLHPLSRQHVDTGAGFERILMVLEGVRSNYETSLFKPLIERLVDLSGVPYSPGDEGVPHRVAADHVRALAFSLADGVLPSNEGRGYVIRRILRRAARYGREIGLESPFIFKLVDPLVDVMGADYPELKQRRDHIAGVIRAEEEGFARTLGRGLEIFGTIAEKLEVSGGAKFPGDEAFKLYDTYGFPLDLTELMARERGLEVDVEQFHQLMERQRSQGRSEGGFGATDEDYGEGVGSRFVGYEDLEVQAKVVSISVRDKRFDIVLDSTPFYAEGGGQVSDSGLIEFTRGRLDVDEVVRVGDVISHRGAVSGALPEGGDEVRAVVFPEHRFPTQYNHTATHLLHTALRHHIGQHASQAGSLVAPDRLRFDFTHFEKLSPEMVEQIEKTVNESIRADYPVKWYNIPFKDALASGVTALFGEKYGDVVRVVQIGADDDPYSRELCGGTHVRRTGELGLFRITYEGAVSAGVRRIEALTGAVALEYTMEEHRALEAMQELISSHGSDPVDKLRKMLEEKKAAEKERETLLKSWAESVAAELLQGAETMGDVKVVARVFDGVDMDRLKMVGDAIRETEFRSVALLASPHHNGSGHLCCVVGDGLLSEGKLKAGELVSRAAKLAGGGGGGRPHMATAGTKRPEKLAEAVAAFSNLVREALAG